MSREEGHESEDELYEGLTIYILSEEIIEKIFSYLDHPSIKAVRLVTRQWKNIIESPKFWSWAELKVDRSNLQAVLESKLVQLVTGIEIIRSLNTADFLRLVEDLFTKRLALSQLTDLKGPYLTTEQLGALFRAIQESADLKLKTLNIEGNCNTSAVEPGLLQAVVKLEQCRLSDFNLLTEQLRVMFRAIQESTDLKLKTLNIWDNSDLVLVEPELLMGLVRLETCNLSECRLTAEQLTALLTSIQESTDLTLKTLNISGCSDLNSVEPGLLQAVVRLENCNLNYSMPTTEQLTLLFRAIQESEDCVLRELDLKCCVLSGVAPDILEDTLARLERVDLSYTRLTALQLTEIFKLLAERSSVKLRSVNIKGNENIKEVESSLRDTAGENQDVEIHY